MRKIITVLVIASFISFLPARAQQIEKIKGKDIVQLMYGLNSEIEGVRESSIYQGIKYRIKEISKKLYDIFLYDPSTEVRKMSVHALFAIEGKSAVDIFFKASFKDTDPNIRFLCGEYYYQLTGKKIARRFKEKK